MIGIFGGTFDPVHLGHRRAIDLVCQAVSFERVHWVLSARPPHKRSVSAEIEQRFDMLRLALADQPQFIADRTEIERATKSYTIDTVEAFRLQYPDRSLCVIIGGDSLHNLHTWHRYDDLMQSTNWVVMHRPGYRLNVPRELRSRLVESPAELQEYECGKILVFAESSFMVSSTQLRAALTANEAQTSEQRALVAQYLCPDVLDYIQAQRLYAAPTI